MPSHSSKLLKVNSYLIEAGIVLLLVGATVIINWKMLRNGLNGMSDLKWHVTWLQHFSKQLGEGIWYPRWLAGTNYGYGSPTFVFYAPLVYYLGSLLKFSGLSTENTIIALFSLAFFLSGLTFYIYGRRWGRIPAFVGALAYMTVPYLAFEVYWRGGLASVSLQALVPLGWWLTHKALAQPKWRVFLALFWTTIALIHTASLLLFAIVWLAYTLFFLFKQPIKAVLATIFAAGIGLGIASLYLLPAILEQSFVNIDEIAHFAGGFRKGMVGTGLPFFPFQFGANIPYIFVHQSIAIAVLTLIVFLFCRQNRELVRETWRWLAFSVAIAILITPLSLPIWEISPTLQMVQFPWRFLQFYSFGAAVLVAIAVRGILKLQLPSKILLLSLVAGILLINFGYSYQLSRQYMTLDHPDSDSVKHLAYLKIALYDPYTDKLIDVPEYRPLLKEDRLNPPLPAIAQPKFSLVSGKATIALQEWSSYNRVLKVNAKETSTIKIRTYYYPAWHLYINHRPWAIAVSDDGAIALQLKPGTYTIQLRYEATTAFKVGVVLSIISLIVLIFYWIEVSMVQFKLLKGWQ